MTFDPTLLDAPISWRDPDLAGFLEMLQGNILKGHGRDQTLNTFFTFNQANQVALKTAIRAIGSKITTAAEQLRDADKHRSRVLTADHEEIDAGPVKFFFLTASGYRALGVQPPADIAFREGMAERGAALADPARDEAPWFEHWASPDLHAMLLVGDDTPGRIAAVSEVLEQLLTGAGARILGRDAGHALRGKPTQSEPKGAGLEHFGYVDGISQPLMLVDEIARAQPLPVFELAPAMAAVVKDPNATRTDAYGSYLVYRRLEQNVKGFKGLEGGGSPNGSQGNLATALGLANSPADPDARELAGALVVGRFENGAPVTLHARDADANGVDFAPDNRFDYSSDGGGNRCPFHAHIRKTNPRDGQKDRLMPRRAIPFGERTPESIEDLDQMPTGGVGLLFMAYNAEIERQFEFVQRSWANNPGFPFQAPGGAGLDPVIGQGALTDQHWPTAYGQPGRTDFAFGGFVTMTGGAYFFAPSIEFLKSVT